MNRAPIEIDLDAILALPERERAEELARVAILKRKLEGNPLWGYMPHEGELEHKRAHGLEITGGESRGQVEFHEQNVAQRHVAAIVAGNRFGKTHAGAVDNLIQILPPEFLPPWLEPYRRRPWVGDYHFRTVCVDLPNALQKVWLPKLRKLVPPAALHKGSFEKAWNDRWRTLTFADGSWWDFLTHDMEVDAFAGAELDRVLFDEEPPGTKGKAQYEESISRLVDRDGDVRFTLTPLLGLNWVYQELTADDEPRRDDEVWVVTGSMEHNPTLSTRMQERLKKRWAKNPLMLQARLHGRFVHFAGLIYDEFREAPPPEGHVVPERPIPREHRDAKPKVPVYASIDPGLDHPAALVFFWVDHEDVAEVFYAQKWQGFIVADVARMYHEVCQHLNFRPRWTTIDPSAKNRNPQTGRNIQHEFSQHGIHTIPGQNARLAGYDHVKERLRTGRLVVQAQCEQLIDEFRSYRWKERKSQVEDAPPQEPIKVNDDLLDALRYGLMSMPVAAKPDKPEEEDKSAAQRAFEADLRRRSRRNRRARVGVCR